MDFDFTEQPAQDRYRLLTNFIGARPIALVPTRSPNGQDNAATRLHANYYITSDRQFEMRTPDIASFAALKTKTN